MATCAYSNGSGAEAQRLGGDLEVCAHPCCWSVADYCFRGDSTREEAAGCPHQHEDLDPMGI